MFPISHCLAIMIAVATIVVKSLNDQSPIKKSDF